VFSLKWQLQSLHVIANLFWIGAIVAVGVLLTAQSTGSVKERAGLALRVYGAVAVPAFVVSFLAGALRLAQDLPYYFKETHFMHAKLPLALGVIAIHHVLGARARRMAKGSVADAGPARTLTLVLAVCAAVAAWLALTELRF
jgi:putative membrane protein